jgi:hydrogenase maturation protein HypF
MNCSATGRVGLAEQATPLALVMTSANPGGEPLVKDDAEARESLAGLADAFLTHDRDILHRCDDSVMKWQGKTPTFVRRARGYTPRRIKLPISGPVDSGLRGMAEKYRVHHARQRSFRLATYRRSRSCGLRGRCWTRRSTYLCDILDVQPQAVAHDLHPDFYSTQFAQAYAAQHDLPVFAVQHHHAHIAAICAEHRITEPVLGLALDGVGLGTTAAPGAVSCCACKARTASAWDISHRCSMPGGDRAAREPWRMAAAALFDMNRADEIVRRFPDQAGAEMVTDMLQRQLNCVATSSMGRWFDAAAGLLGVSEIQGYEGQAAMLLEGLAERYGKVGPLPLGYIFHGAERIGFSPAAGESGRLQRCGLRRGLVPCHACRRSVRMGATCRRASGIKHVALGGGCFLNNILSQALTESLTAQV